MPQTLHNGGSAFSGVAIDCSPPSASLIEKRQLVKVVKAMLDTVRLGTQKSVLYSGVAIDCSTRESHALAESL